MIWPPPGFKVALEEGRSRREADWQDFAFVLCRKGQIYKFSDTELAAWVERPNRKAFEMLKKSGLPGKVFVETDGGGIWLFPSRNFNELADFMGARKRRRVSEAQRKAASERFKKFHQARRSIHKPL